MRDPIVGVKAHSLLVALNGQIGFIGVTLAGLQVVDEPVKKVQVGVARINLQRLVDGLTGLRQLEL